MNGDVAALFRRHHEALFAYCVRLSGDAELAADATQEAFVRMIETRPTCTNPRAWLFTVATNHVRETGRTASRREEILREAATSVAPPAPSPPDAEAFGRIDAQRVSSALMTLSERDRTVLLMRQEGFKHREIAEAVGTTTGAVGTMIARALDALVAALPQTTGAST